METESLLKRPLLKSRGQAIGNESRDLVLYTKFKHDMKASIQTVVGLSTVTKNLAAASTFHTKDQIEDLCETCEETAVRFLIITERACASDIASELVNSVDRGKINFIDIFYLHRQFYAGSFGSLIV